MSSLVVDRRISGVFRQRHDPRNGEKAECIVKADVLESGETEEAEVADEAEEAGNVKELPSPSRLSGTVDISSFSSDDTSEGCCIRCCSQTRRGGTWKLHETAGRGLGDGGCHVKRRGQSCRSRRGSPRPDSTSSIVAEREGCSSNLRSVTERQNSAPQGFCGPQIEGHLDAHGVERDCI